MNSNSIVANGNSGPNEMSENVAYAPHIKKEDSEISHEYETVLGNQRESPPHEVYLTICGSESGHSQLDQGKERKNPVSNHQRESPPHKVSIFDDKSQQDQGTEGENHDRLD